MASFKVSNFSGVADTTDDSLLMLSYTADNGATYDALEVIRKRLDLDIG